MDKLDKLEQSFFLADYIYIVICDHNQQESRLDIQQHWDIFAVFGLFPWSTVCCYFMGHK